MTTIKLLLNFGKLIKSKANHTQIENKNNYNLYKNIRKT